MDNTFTVKKIYAAWIYVSNLEQSIDFYRNRIGLKIKFRNSDWVEFDLGATSFALLKRPPEKGKVTPVKTHIMFETEDIQKFYNMAIEAGIKLIGEVRNEEYGSLLTFEDPDGHWLEIYQDKAAYSRS
jgi:metallothiol transferase